MRFPVIVCLKNRATNETVEGIIRPTIFPDILRWLSWVYREDDEDQSWNWLKIFSECKSSEGRYECYSLLVDEVLHGLMALDLQGRDGPSERGLVVDHLATNPANRKTDPQRIGAVFKHIGASLMAVAVARSMECKMSGAIWLESLHGARTFYEGLGFQKQPGVSEEGNVIYFLDSITAKEMLQFAKRTAVTL